MYVNQRTLRKPVRFRGIGLHSGKTVDLTIKPAPINHGIRFVRVDLPGTPGVTAQFNRVVDTSLATVIGSDGCIVSTIEHLMATFSGLFIDNALIELDAYCEVPVMDGSAGPFTEQITKSGIENQRVPRHFFCAQRAYRTGRWGQICYRLPVGRFQNILHHRFRSPTDRSPISGRRRD